MVHAHDSHTGAAVWWLATEGRENPFFRDVASVFTIHNLPYAAQGAGRLSATTRSGGPTRSRRCPESFRDSLMGLGILGGGLPLDRLADVCPRDPDAARAATASTASCGCGRTASPGS